MRIIYAMPVVALLFVLSQVVKADDWDGNQLLVDCKMAVRAVLDGDTQDVEQSDLARVGVCLGQVQGVQATAQLYSQVLSINIANNAREENPFLLCYPDAGLTNGQAIRIVTKFLEDNPSRLHEAGTILALEALIDAFRCNK